MLYYLTVTTCNIVVLQKGYPEAICAKWPIGPNQFMELHECDEPVVNNASSACHLHTLLLMETVDKGIEFHHGFEDVNLFAI